MISNIFKPADKRAKLIENFRSRDQLTDLLDKNSICAELGVAEGGFSTKLLESDNVEFLYSIDRYSGERGHDERQYLKALQELDNYKNRNSLIKLDFSNALQLFPDNYFDLIYIDGYAHEGQNDGKTFNDWFAKLKQGGIFAGDDYSEKYPKNIAAIDSFARNNRLNLHILNDWYRPKSWVMFKA